MPLGSNVIFICWNATSSSSSTESQSCWSCSITVSTKVSDSIGIVHSLSRGSTPRRTFFPSRLSREADASLVPRALGSTGSFFFLSSRRGCDAGRSGTGHDADSASYVDSRLLDPVCSVYGAGDVAPLAAFDACEQGASDGAG